MLQNSVQWQESQQQDPLSWTHTENWLKQSTEQLLQVRQPFRILSQQMILLKPLLKELLKAQRLISTHYFSSGAITVDLEILGSPVQNTLITYIPSLGRNYMGKPSPIAFESLQQYDEFISVLQ